jgi:DNA-binding PadR family transcriptional regulator
MYGRYRVYRESWHESPFHKGALKYIILDLIKDQPNHGYQIIRILEKRTHGLYVPSAGAVYPTLQLLEEMGYVTAVEQEGKKVYSITDEGRRFLADSDELAEGIKKRMRERWGVRDSREPRETIAELKELGRLFAWRYRHLDQEKVRRIKEIVSRAHTEIEAVMMEPPKSGSLPGSI